jgi:hypothetical protein
MLLAAPPFIGGVISNYIKCAATDKWCSGINVDFKTGHDIATPPPM